MKTKKAILLMAAVSLWAADGFAQNQGTVPRAPKPETNPPPAVATPPRSLTATNPAPAAPASSEAADLANAAGSESPGVEPLIQFDDADLFTAIKSLARLANMNIMFDEKLTAVGPDGKPLVPARKISDRFANVTPQEALDALLSNYHMQMMPDPKTTKAKIYRVAPLDANALEPLVTKVIPLKYASPTNLLDVVRTAFANTNRSRVIPDIRTSQIVVVATEREMDAVQKLIGLVDTPTKQVLIEARLLETAQNPHSIRGIDWSGTLLAQNLAFGNGAVGGQTVTTTPGTPTTTTLPSGRPVTTTPDSTSATTVNTIFGSSPTLGSLAGFALNTARGVQPDVAFLNADGVHAVLSALNQEADTEVLATPRAVTLDNQSAVLSVTKAFPIFQQNPGSPNTPATSTVVYTNVGTILTVTPRISGGTNVALKVVPEVSSIDVKDTQIINGQQNEANVFAFRKIEANVLIPSGNTLVMGGLISDSTTKAYTKVPVLGDLPILGLAFRHEDKQRTKQNLLIFITPTVIQDSDFQPTKTDFLKQPVPRDVLDNDVKPGLGHGGGSFNKDKPLLQQ